MSLLDNLFPKNQTSSSVGEQPTSSQVMPVEPVSSEQSGVELSSSVNPSKQQDISVMSHLDTRSTQALAAAFSETKAIKKPFIEPEQLLLGLVADREIFKLLQDFGIDVGQLDRELKSQEELGIFGGEPSLSEMSKHILEDAYSSVKERKLEFISPEDILVALFNKDILATKTLEAKGLDKNKLSDKLSSNPQFNDGQKSVLQKYGVDLVQKARDGKLDPITGRDREIERMVHILLRRTKNNPIIIGESGTGKTAIVEGLAQMIANSQVPDDLKNKKVIQLEISSLVAGASHRGEFEERLNNVIKEVMASNNAIILFIDEIHTLLGAGDTDGALDASNIIKPYLSRGQIQVIGATTTSEFRKYFEKDRAFERRFQPIMCDEPSEEVAETMLKILQPKYENYHKITFSPEAIKASVHLSKRYIGERFLPDKAIDLLDEAGAQVRLLVSEKKRTDTIVSAADIEQVVSRWTGIPITKLTEKESDKLLHLEALIHKQFINHEHAVNSIAEAIRRGRIGLSNANRPIASFVFLGPTGTGKTELAKVLAEIMFGRKDAMIRLDMSEYMEKHEVAKLLGAPPGYVGYEEGGQLTEAVRTKPYSIVLFDEIEKAHPDVFNILLQLLEDGRLTDNKGNTVSFKNTVVICTSNIGSELIRQKLMSDAKDVHDAVITPQAVQSPGTMSAGVGMSIPTENPLQPYTGVADLHAPKNDAKLPPIAQQSNEQDEQKNFKELTKIVMEELTKFFRPELVNRFDEVVVFEPLSEENMVFISKLAVEATARMLKDQNISLNISDAAQKQLAHEGYDPVYGARPLRRLIQKSIENPISVLLINKTFVAGDTIMVDYDGANDKFTFTKPTASNIDSTQPGMSGYQQPGSVVPTEIPTTELNSSNVMPQQHIAPTEIANLGGVTNDPSLPDGSGGVS
jgi:ATP-dependent Clp protease ATP-binding subunit ClpC